MKTLSILNSTRRSWGGNMLGGESLQNQKHHLSKTRGSKIIAIGINIPVIVTIISMKYNTKAYICNEY